MQTILMIPDHQTEYFEKKAAELDIPVRKNGKHHAKPETFYDVNYANDLELYYLTEAMGFLNTLEAMHQPDKTLQN
jgi:hypothetical protein